MINDGNLPEGQIPFLTLISALGLENCLPAGFLGDENKTMSYLVDLIA